MRSLRGLSLFAGIPVTAVIVSCAAGPTGGYVAGDPSDDISGIETSLSVEPTSIVASEGAKIEVVIGNSTESDVQFRFPDNRQVVLLIRDLSGNLLYTDDHTLAVPQYLSLGTLEEWTHTIEWDGRVRIAGQRLELPIGRYEFQVALRRSGALYVNRTAPVEIEMIRSGR